MFLSAFSRQGMCSLNSLKSKLEILSVGMVLKLDFKATEISRINGDIFQLLGNFLTEGDRQPLPSQAGLISWNWQKGHAAGKLRSSHHSCRSTC